MRPRKPGEGSRGFPKHVSFFPVNVNEEVMALDKRKKSGSKVTFADIILSVLPWPFHKDLPKDRSGNKRKITLGDLILSVLPWPFHKDLPSPSAEDDEVEENKS